MSPQAASAQPQARTAKTRDRIERAALEAFSEMGFDAASTREIAKRAGVKQQLISYHYGSKLGLWKASVDREFGDFGERIESRLAGLEGVDPATQLRLLLREFILYSAEHPEIARFMMHESGRPGPRFTWLYERHTKFLIERLIEGFELAQERGLAAQGDPTHLVYVLIGGVSIFSHNAEVELLTQGRSREPAALGDYVETLLRLVLPGVPPPEA
jgi:TetR/AcrR family transcriptional regulator